MTVINVTLLQFVGDSYAYLCLTEKSKVQLLFVIQKTAEKQKKTNYKRNTFGKKIL